MTIFNRSLVALDLSSTDEQVLSFCNFLFQSLETKTTYFLHIIPNFVYPDNIELEFQKMFAPEIPLDEKVRERIAESISEFCPRAEQLETHVEVIEGKPYQKLLHWTEVKSADLLVVGNKKDSDGSGITPRKIAKNAKSSICYIGTKSNPNVKRILVGVDYSDFSKRAILTAVQMKKQNPEIEIIALNLMDLPSTAIKINKNHAEFVRRMEKIAHEKMLVFLARLGVHKSVSTVYEMNEYFDVAKHLRHYAKKNEIDMIVIGAQGHSYFDNFLYGSVAEKLVHREKELPVLVVR